MTRMLTSMLFVFYLAFAIVRPAAAQDPGAGAPAATTFVGAPPPGKAQIVFFREGEFLGSALTFPIVRSDGGKEVGRLANGHYFVVTVDPGEHAYETAKHFHPADIKISDVAAGQTYYVKLSVKAGMVGFFPGPVGTILTRTDNLEFEKVAAKLTLYSLSK